MKSAVIRSLGHPRSLSSSLPKYFLDVNKGLKDEGGKRKTRRRRESGWKDKQTQKRFDMASRWCLWRGGFYERISFEWDEAIEDPFSHIHSLFCYKKQKNGNLNSFSDDGFGVKRKNNDFPFYYAMMLLSLSLSASLFREALKNPPAYTYIYAELSHTPWCVSEFTSFCWTFFSLPLSHPLLFVLLRLYFDGKKIY